MALLSLLVYFQMSGTILEIYSGALSTCIRLHCLSFLHFFKTFIRVLVPSKCAETGVGGPSGCTFIFMLV